MDKRDRLPAVIAVEEHFMHDTLARHLGPATNAPAHIKERLFDFIGIRLQEMDTAGIGMQVLSHQSPGSQRLGEDVAIDACKAVNDALAGVIRERPDRFAGFAMIPTIAPEAAADELQRAVEQLGLKGAMIHGLSHGRFVDTPDFWPVYARAEALGVPVYLHPALPDRTVTETYYAPYSETHPDLLRAAWGFGVEAGTQAVRLILSGVFEKHPDLKIILGHLGEGLPFLLERVDESFSRPGGKPVKIREIFCNNFYVTTSGFFSTPALLCTMQELGIDRIMYSVDWPYVEFENGTDWLKKIQINPPDMEKLLSGNARKLLKL